MDVWWFPTIWHLKLWFIIQLKQPFQIYHTLILRLPENRFLFWFFSAPSNGQFPDFSKQVWKKSPIYSIYLLKCTEPGNSSRCGSFNFHQLICRPKILKPDVSSCVTKCYEFLCFPGTFKTCSWSFELVIRKYDPQTHCWCTHFFPWAKMTYVYRVIHVWDVHILNNLGSLL